ncbi:MAG: hypothetical protein AAF798_05295 [Bacteroidota bacterium]
MEIFEIKLKDQSKKQFLLELLEQLNFIELNIKEDEGVDSAHPYDFFDSAGLFEDREMDANQLRKQAWRINN